MYPKSIEMKITAKIEGRRKRARADCVHLDSFFFFFFFFLVCFVYFRQFAKEALSNFFSFFFFPFFFFLVCFYNYEKILHLNVSVQSYLHCERGWSIKRVVLSGSRELESLKLESIGGARRFVVLQINGATSGRRCQIDAVAGQTLLIGADPHGQRVWVVSRNNGHICNLTKIIVLKLNFLLFFLECGSNFMQLSHSNMEDFHITNTRGHPIKDVKCKYYPKVFIFIKSNTVSLRVVKNSFWYMFVTSPTCDA